MLNCRNTTQTMNSQARGPYVDLRLSSSDQEPAIEMRQGNAGGATATSSYPEVSLTELLKALVPAAIMLIIVFWINAAHAAFVDTYVQGDLLSRSKDNFEAKFLHFVRDLKSHLSQFAVSKC